MRALSAAEYVHQGVWVNWHKDQGPVLGSTLTVGPYLASLLSPAIAIFISIAGAQLWRLFQFALHQARATADERPLIHHQQQVILRNTATDLNTIWRLVRTAFAWRHQKDVRAIRVSLPLILWSVIHFTLIILAGLFSSWLLETGDFVLSRSPYCGTFKQDYVDTLNSLDTDPDHLAVVMDYTHYHNARYGYFQQHVDICENGQNGTEGCDLMVASSLNWTQKFLPDMCPFGEGLCNPRSNGSIQLDTGFISSSSGLGYNTRPNDRVSVRFLAQCSPLDDERFGTGWIDVPATGSVSAHRVADVMYGPSVVNNRNATFSRIEQIMDCSQSAGTNPFSLDSSFIASGGGDGLFQPIEGLNQSDADLSLVSMASFNSWVHPTADPWYSANQAVNNSNGFCLGLPGTFYKADRPISTIGCSEQWQVCSKEMQNDEADQTCTPLMGLTQMQDYIATSSDNIELNTIQQATVDRIINAAMGSSFYYVINALSATNAQPLKAASLAGQGYGIQLPVDQWQKETEYWMQILLAQLQQTSLDFSTGQFANSIAHIDVFQKPSNKSAEAAGQAAAYHLCQNQLIQSKVYKNYNFFALIVLIVLCTVILALGLGIEDFIGYLRQRSLRYSGEYGKQGMWNTNSDLEMLRTIDELKNQSSWGITRNGVWVGPPGYKVNINELKAPTHEVGKGSGLIHVAVKRTQSDLYSPSSTASSCGKGFEKCHTCKVSVSSSTSSDSLTSSPPIKSDMAVNKGYQNTFNANFKYAIPKGQFTNAEVTELTRVETLTPVSQATNGVKVSQRFPVVFSKAKVPKTTHSNFIDGYDFSRPSPEMPRGHGINESRVVIDGANASIQQQDSINSSDNSGKAIDSKIRVQPATYHVYKAPVEAENAVKDVDGSKDVWSKLPKQVSRLLSSKTNTKSRVGNTDYVQ